MVKSYTLPIWVQVYLFAFTDGKLVSVSVSVPEGDAIFVSKLQDFTATEKDELILDCELSKDVPVIWYHSEKEITASKMVVLKSEGTSRSLVLKKVEQSNKGTYTCDCGTDKTSAVVDVQGLNPNC